MPSLARISLADQQLIHDWPLYCSATLEDSLVMGHNGHPWGQGSRVHGSLEMSSFLTKCGVSSVGRLYIILMLYQK